MMSRYLVESQVNKGKEVFWITNADSLMIEPLPSRYLKHKSNEHLSPNTVKAIAYAISYYLMYLDEENLTVSEMFDMPYSVQFEHFSDYLEWLKSGSHCNRAQLPNNNTCNTYLAVVFRYLQFLQMEQQSGGDLKVLTEKEASYVNDVGVRFKRMVMHFNGYLPPNEHRSREVAGANLTILLNACSCLRDKVLLMLLAETGMRIGEVLGVNYVRDIDYEKRIIRVEMREDNENRARAKNAEYRNTYFSKETLELIQSYLSENAELLSRTEYLFINLHGKTAGNAMSVNAVYSVLKILEKRTGIRITPHMLRHYFANERRKAGWEILDISTALGHRSIRTTEEYLSVSDEELEVAAEKYYEENQALYDIRNLL
ncbi:MAG: tyrosine-type recombinase/integrase [Lachnospiraceae bacterium]|nr:tyrosine-type recombinase/integrase [Lachnospiraceae bacterium]